MCPDPNNGHRYNDRCITKLLASYRSHASILELPSKLFYNSELHAKGDAAIINSMLQVSDLMKQIRPKITDEILSDQI
jgi:superfamily I DNA and/or RNA helicase